MYVCMFSTYVTLIVYTALLLYVCRNNILLSLCVLFLVFPGGSDLALLVSSTSVTEDSVTLSVIVTPQCIRSVITNITVTYHPQSTNNTITRTATHPNSSDSAFISLTGLQSSTSYTAVVSVYYYSRNDGINLLGPQNINFTTTQSQCKFILCVMS